MTQMPATIEEQVSLPGRGGRRPPPGDAGGSGLTPGDFLRILQQRMFLVLFIWIFVAGASVGGTWLWIRYWPAWEAVGFIHVISTNPQPVMEQGANPMRGDLMERLLQDQVVMLKDVGVLLSVLGDASVRNTKWFKSYEQDSAQRLLDLRDDLVCVPMKGSSYVKVSFMCPDPQDFVLVNAVLDKYYIEAKNRYEAPYSAEKSALNEEVGDLRDQIDIQRRAITTFVQDEMPAGGTEMFANPITISLQNVTAQLTVAREQEFELDGIRLVYENSAPRSAPLNITQMVEQDPRVVSLSAQLQGLEYQIDVQKFSGLGAQHRWVRNYTVLRDVLEQNLNRFRQYQTDMLLNYQRYLAQVQWEVAHKKVMDLEEARVDFDAQHRDLDRKRAEHRKMTDRLEQLQKMHDNQLEAQRQLNLAISAKRTFRVTRVGALEPRERAQPRWEINVPVGTVLGLLLGVGFAILFEFMDTSVRTGRDLVRHVNIPVLGTVPDLDDEEIAIDDINTVVSKAPNSMAAEAFRTIRTNLQLSAPAERQRTVLITSPQPEDGKTAVAVNLATAIANNHRRVLLVDANFRRPALNGVFGPPPSKGLSDLLIGQASLDACIKPSGVDRLDVLFCGRVPPNPAELLSSPEMRALIDEVSGKYDQILFDGPPLLLVSDALVLGSAVDAVLVVCRAKVNSRGVVQRTRDRLLDVNARIIGAVLNAAQVRRGGYFREQYRAFYDYQTSENPALESPRDKDKSGRA